MEQDSDKPMANPMVVLREEFDDWALLFDPDTNNIFAIDPVSVFIWKLLDGKHSLDDILKELHKNCEGVPDDAQLHVADFIRQLLSCGLAGSQLKENPA